MTKPIEPESTTEADGPSLMKHLGALRADFATMRAVGGPLTHPDGHVSHEGFYADEADRIEGLLASVSHPFAEWDARHAKHVAAHSRTAQ